jgi:hypothetical protein
LHLSGGANVPVGATVNQVAEQALAQAQIKVILTPGVHDVNGRSATAGAQSLLISGGGGQLGIIIGGATAHASASLPFETPVGARPNAAALAATTGSATDSGGAASGSSSPTLAAVGSATTPTEPAQTPALLSRLGTLVGHANPFWLMLLGAFVGWVIAGFLHRLGTGILATTDPCDIGAAP